MTHPESTSHNDHDGSQPAEEPGRDQTRRTTLEHLRRDLPASLVVFLVALPLCMGIAIASGAPIAAGIITGIIGGVVTGAFAGSPLQVSGPAAGLTVVVFDLIQHIGLEMIGLAVLVAGGMQIAAGMLKIGQWFRAVSPAVVHGMLSGIGVLILASQFHVMVDDTPKKTGPSNLLTIPSAIVKAIGTTRLTDREERQLRKSELQVIGDLHRRQLGLRERILERLPDHAHPEELRGHSVRELIDNEQAFGSFVREQEGIHADLQAAVRVLQASELKIHDRERAAQIRSAANAALAASRITLDELQSRQIDAATLIKAQGTAANTMTEFLMSLRNHSWAAYMGILTIVTIVLWERFGKRHLPIVPAPLLGISAATIVAATLALPIVSVEVPNNLLNDVHIIGSATLTDAPWAGVIEAALVIALIASAETLLCAVALDQMHTGPRTKFDQELTAQGIGNMCCGLLGALPMTGVIVRSSANVAAGARSRMSTIFHGIWLLLFVTSLESILRLIPTSSLAATLVYIGYRLIDLTKIKDLWRHGKAEVGIYLATATIVVGVDLLTGVIIGIILSGANLLHRITYLEVSSEPMETVNGRVIRLRGYATFVVLPRLASALDEVNPGDTITLDVDQLAFVDHACLELLRGWANQHEATGGKLVVDWKRLELPLSANKRSEG